MPNPLAPNAVMQYGAQYTFEFSQSSIPGVAANNNEIVSAVIASFPQAAQVSVSGESTFGGTVDVTFTYNDPDNSDDVTDLGQAMAIAISTQFTLDSFTFVQAYGGPSGSQGAPNSDTTGLGNALGDVSGAAIAIAVLIVVAFVAIKFS